MQSAYPNTSLIPLRKMPSDRSEMTTQVLFGQEVEVLDVLNQWIRIRIKEDGYEGWADRKMFFESRKSREESLPMILEWYLPVLIRETGSQILLPPGSHLHGVNLEKKCFVYNELSYCWDGDIQLPERGDPAVSVCSLARKFKGSPYLWGGKSPQGIDCSGLVQVVFRINGIQLPRDAKQQAGAGRSIGFVQQAQAGDLAFFGKKDGEITHVGIITGEGSIVHSSGQVREDMLDQEGIFREGTGQYSHTLKLIKRIL